MLKSGRFGVRGQLYQGSATRWYYYVRSALARLYRSNGLRKKREARGALMGPKTKDGQ
jgi:hypothetical protein